MRLDRNPASYRDYGDGILIHELANIAGDVDVGPSTRIDAYATITGRVIIGARCHIGPGVGIFGSAGVTIGDECSLSAGSRIFTGTFDRRTGYKANPMLADKVYAEGPVVMGSRCILGCNSVILPNVTLADDVLIGALCLVKHNLAAGLYAGIPVHHVASP